MYFDSMTYLSARKSRDKFSDRVCHSHTFFKYCSIPPYMGIVIGIHAISMSARLIPSNDAINNGVQTYPNGFLAPAFAVPVTHLITHIAKRYKMATKRTRRRLSSPGFPFICLQSISLFQIRVPNICYTHT